MRTRHDFSQKGPRWRWSTLIRLAPAGADRSTSGAARRSKPTPNVRSGSWRTVSIESALKPLDEGLAKVPANPWLSTRKALVQLQLNQFDAAKLTLREIAPEPSRQPGGIGPLTRLVVETEGPVEGAAQFQQALSNVRDRRARPACIAGRHLSVRRWARLGIAPAALQASRTRRSPGAEEIKQSASLVQEPQDEPGDFRLGEESLSSLAGPRPGDRSHSANRSSGRSSGRTRGSGRPRHRRSSCWRRARRRMRSPTAIGACVACGSPITRAPSPHFDDTSRAPAPRSTPWSSRHSARGSTAVAPYDQVEFVHLSWPIRNRDGLLAASPRQQAFRGGAQDRPVDPNDPKSPEVERFFRARSSPDRGEDRADAQRDSDGRWRALGRSTTL